MEKGFGILMMVFIAVVVGLDQRTIDIIRPEAKRFSEDQIFPESLPNSMASKVKVEDVKSAPSEPSVGPSTLLESVRPKEKTISRQEKAREPSLRLYKGRLIKKTVNPYLGSGPSEDL